MSQIKPKNTESNQTGNCKTNRTEKSKSNQVGNGDSNPIGNGELNQVAKKDQCVTTDSGDGTRVGYSTALDKQVE